MAALPAPQPIGTGKLPLLGLDMWLALRSQRLGHTLVRGEVPSVTRILSRDALTSLPSSVANKGTNSVSDT
ncbi:hypothetical protein MUK42_25778 [Musa troglodytarum]|uniref:Uncharacterized protein n=1 Tax=Musa troglodytarum TaxID=320322 RepID=A0A9E7EYI1_9LILI|nr:hypothetical protein MUK42_25778 [Musa troglodytarum]